MKLLDLCGIVACGGGRAPEGYPNACHGVDAGGALGCSGMLGAWYMVKCLKVAFDFVRVDSVSVRAQRLCSGVGRYRRNNDRLAPH